MQEPGFQEFARYLSRTNIHKTMNTKNYMLKIKICAANYD